MICCDQCEYIFCLSLTLSLLPVCSSESLSVSLVLSESCHRVASAHMEHSISGCLFIQAGFEVMGYF